MPPAVSRQPTLRLASDACIECSPSAGLHVLRYRAGCVPLNDAAVAILSLCDGRHSRLDVMKRVKLPPRHVDAFIDAACAMAWITEDVSDIRKH